jgi:hypothetical protein
LVSTLFRYVVDEPTIHFSLINTANDGFLNLPNPSGRTRPWSNEYQKYKKIMFLGSKVRRVRRADKLTTIYEPIV